MSPTASLLSGSSPHKSTHTCTRWEQRKILVLFCNPLVVKWMFVPRCYSLSLRCCFFFFHKQERIGEKEDDKSHWKWSLGKSLELPKASFPVQEAEEPTNFEVEMEKAVVAPAEAGEIYPYVLPFLFFITTYYGSYKKPCIWADS